MAVRLMLPDNPLYRELQERMMAKTTTSQYVKRRIDKLPLLFIGEYVRSHPDDYLILGNNSIANMSTREKFLYQWPWTAGDIAREYLTLCVERSGESLRRQRTIEKAHAPTYFAGPSAGYYAYVDIRACFYSLWNLLTLDSSYLDFEVSLGNIPFIERPQFGMSKRVRNLTFGILCKNKMTVWKKGKYDEVRSTTLLYRPDIVTYVFHTVQAVAQEAIRLYDIHMWLTDAAILPANQASDFQVFLAEEWALDSRILAEGSSSLLSTGCYRVGEKMTKHYTRHQAKGPKCHSLIPKIDGKYLKETRKWLLSASESHRRNWLGLGSEQELRPPLAP